MTEEEITDCVRMLHRVMQTDFNIAALSDGDMLIANMLYSADGQSSRRILMRLIDKLRGRTKPAEGASQRLRRKVPGLTNEVADQFVKAFSQLSPEDIDRAIMTIANYNNPEVSTVDDDVYFFLIQNRNRLRNSDQLARTLYEYERKRSRRPIDERDDEEIDFIDEGE